MKHLRNGYIWRILKILCIILCMVFLFTACGSGEGQSIGAGGDRKQTIEAQRNCYMEVSEDGKTKTICPKEEGDTENSQYKEGTHDCMQASILKAFYSGLGQMATSVYNKMTSENLLSLMFLAFSIWMAFQILRHVSATTPESLGEFWTKILRKATLCAACGILASSSENIYYTVNTFILPIYVTLLEFASAVLELLSKTPAAQSDTLEIPIIPNNTPGAIDFAKELASGNGSVQAISEPLTHRLDNVACQITDSESIKMSENKFPDGPSNLMGCMACAVSDRLNIGYTIASLVMNSPGLFMTLIGILLFAVFTIVKWGFALYLVDSIFRLTMMIIIMPFLILFFPFEQTRKWTTTGFKIILNSAGIMLCLAILVGITIFAMEEVLKNGSYGDSSVYEKFGTVPLSLMFMAFVMVKVSGLAVSLSESVTGGKGEARFQKKMAALVGTLASAVGVVLSWGASKAVTAALAHSARLRAVAEKVNKAKAKVNQVKNKLNRLAGRPTDDQNDAGNSSAGPDFGGDDDSGADSGGDEDFGDDDFGGDDEDVGDEDDSGGDEEESGT